MKHLGRLVLSLLLCAGFVRPNINTLATISGTGAAVQISTDTQTRATWIQVYAPVTNVSNVMFGDSQTSATRGLPVTPGNGYNTPTCSTCVYTLGATYVYVASGDKAYIAFGN